MFDILPLILKGFPELIFSGLTFLFTRLFAPINAEKPILTPGSIVDLVQIIEKYNDHPCLISLGGII